MAENLQQVPPERLSDEWGRVEGWIESALEFGQGDENLRDLCIAVARGQYALFTTENAAAVVQLQRYPRQSVLVVLYSGGKSLIDMQVAFQAMRQFCRANKIDAIRIHGRKGWERILGMRRAGVILQCSP